MQEVYRETLGLALAVSLTEVRGMCTVYILYERGVVSSFSFCRAILLPSKNHLWSLPTGVRNRTLGDIVSLVARQSQILFQCLLFS